MKKMFLRPLTLEVALRVGGRAVMPKINVDTTANMPTAFSRVILIVLDSVCD